MFLSEEFAAIRAEPMTVKGNGAARTLGGPGGMWGGNDAGN
jgi:hypothetical protein